MLEVAVLEVAVRSGCVRSGCVGSGCVRSGCVTSGCIRGGGATCLKACGCVVSKGMCPAKKLCLKQMLSHSIQTLLS